MVAEAVEVFVILKVNDDLAAAAGGSADLDLRPERVAKFLLQGCDLVAVGSLLLSRAGQDVGCFAVFGE